MATLPTTTTTIVSACFAPWDRELHALKAPSLAAAALNQEQQTPHTALDVVLVGSGGGFDIATLCPTCCYRRFGCRAWCECEKEVDAVGVDPPKRRRSGA